MVIVHWKATGEFEGSFCTGKITASAAVKLIISLASDNTIYDIKAEFV